jgi:hypothetical protein
MAVDMSSINTNRIKNPVTIEDSTVGEIYINSAPEWWPKFAIAAGDITEVDVFKFLDHVKYVKNVSGFPDRRGEICVISEPYSLSSEGVTHLIKFCKIFDLTFAITGECRHNPGNCFRITFFNGKK